MTTKLDGIGAVLSAEFEAGEVLHFTKEWTNKAGQAFSRTFDYIEDETVMDRLDLGVGIGRHSWSFTVVSDTCVRGRCDIAWPDGTASFYEDFGYATRADSAEPLKEAVSDAIRRIGRYVGVARYLYRKHDSTASGGRAGTSSPDRPSAPPRPEALPTPGVPTASVPEEPEDLFPPIGGMSSPAQVPVDHCPIHDVPWLGGPGDYWHKDPEGKYCRHPDNVRKARRAS